MADAFSCALKCDKDPGFSLHGMLQKVGQRRVVVEMVVAILNDHTIVPMSGWKTGLNACLGTAMQGRQAATDDGIHMGLMMASSGQKIRSVVWIAIGNENL